MRPPGAVSLTGGNLKSLSLPNSSTDLAEIWPEFLPGKDHFSPNFAPGLLSGFGEVESQKRRKNETNT